MYSIYVLLKNNTNKNIIANIFYVGLTKRPKERFYAHKKYKDTNILKMRMIKKYGLNPIILWTNLSKKEAISRETFLIKYLGRKDIKTGQLANLTDGGETSTNLSPKTLEQIANKMAILSIKKQKEIAIYLQQNKLSRKEAMKKFDLNSHQIYYIRKKYAKELLGTKKRKYSKQEIEKHINNSKNLNHQEYCKQNNINYNTYHNWLYKAKLTNGHKQRRYSKKEKELIVEKYKKSNLNIRAFAKSHNINYNTCYRWCKEIC